jgi:hypothetical protein
VPTTVGEIGAIAEASGVGVPGRDDGLPVGCGELCAGDTDALADGLPAEADGLAGGATTRAVSVGSGVALPGCEGSSVTTSGEPLDLGDADLVACRSAALCVNTPGAIVTTSSLGCELDRVSTSARKRLASTALAAISALVRFNETSRSRSRPLRTLGTQDGVRVAPTSVDSRAGAEFTLADAKPAAAMTVFA